MVLVQKELKNAYIGSGGGGGGWDMDSWALAQTSSGLPRDWCGGVHLKPDGTKIFFLGGGKLYESTLSPAFDLSGITYTKYIGAYGVEDIWFSPDGTKLVMFRPDYNGGLAVYSLGTAWDISTISGSPTSSVRDSGRGIWFSSDGTKMAIGSGRVIMFNLSTARDVSTRDGGTTLTTTYGGLGIWFSPDGKHFYGQNGESTPYLDYVDMSTGFDFSTITDSGTKNIGEVRAGGLWFNEEGTICVMIGGGSSTNYITKYTL